MKDKVLILANLIQKLALWKTEFNRSNDIEQHIRMLDWVISPFEFTRSIDIIVKDKDYELSPKEYFKKFD